MTNKANPIPEGYNTVTPYLIVNDAAAALEFYKNAFGATELYRMEDTNGKIGHAEIKIGNSPIMLAEEMADMGYLGPRALGGTPVSILLYVENVDALAEQAVLAGAKIVKPVSDQFYGDRTGGVEDPFGHQWYIATHIEDVTPEEIKRRYETAAKQHANA